MKIISLLTFAIILSGCSAKSVKPIVDLKDIDKKQYKADLAECRTLAGETHGIAKNAAIGAITGAVVGAVASAVIDPEGRTGSYGTSVGTVYGGMAGAAEGAIEIRVIVKRCLEGRGYKVIL